MKSKFRSKVLIFKALKTVSVMGYYRNEETWRDIGYDGPTIKRFPPNEPIILERGEKLKPQKIFPPILETTPMSA